MRYFIHILFLLLCSLPLTVAHAEVKVVATVPPLHALAAGVMKGVSTPTLLIKGGQSPHSYSLRPSDAKKLSEADLIVWVGPELESFILKPLSTLASNARQLLLLENKELIRLEQRSGGAWNNHEHHLNEHDHDDEHDQDKDSFNPHLWLDPLNGIKIAQLLSANLIELDPANAEHYRENTKRLETELRQLDEELKKKLESIHDLPYLVFHDAYAYFEERYHLHPLGSISISPDRRPGAKRVAEIRKAITESGARCVFSEPQFKPQMIKTLISGTAAKSGVLDPLGATLTQGEESYFLLLNQMADSLTECLTQ